MAEAAHQRRGAGPGSPPPSPRFPILPVAVVFGGCVLLYALAFGFIEGSRHRKGPWELSFGTDSSGIPSLRIDQPALGIQGVEIRFPRVHLTNGSTRSVVRLDTPARPLPFGNRLHEDLTFLPGVIALELFGHEVEIAPRTLVVDRKEVAWSPNLVMGLEVPPPPAPAANAKGGTSPGR